MTAPIISLAVVLYLVVLHSPGIAAASDIAGEVSGQRPMPLLADASADSCVTECEAVHKQCKLLCSETGARAAVQTGDDPHKPKGTCLQDCEQGYAICKDSC
jgi:hypothetical protein